MTAKQPDPVRARARKESELAKLRQRVEELERELAEQVDVARSAVRELDELKHPPTFDPASLLLLDVEAERMLATWPLVRVRLLSGRGQHVSDVIAGWGFSREAWMELADAGRVSVDRFASLFERLGFVDRETGEAVEPAKVYLRGRVNAEPTGRRRR